MGRPSVRTRTGPASDARDLVVIDSFNHRAGLGGSTPAGVILVLNAFRPLDREALVGLDVHIRTPGGFSATAKVVATRDHGTTISVLIPDLDSGTVPVGSTINFGPTAEALRQASADAFERLLWLARRQMSEDANLGMHAGSASCP